jgi:hypothetical protein
MPESITIDVTQPITTVDVAITTGIPGMGVPPGGTTGQVLAKASNTDNDTEWIAQTGGGGGGGVTDHGALTGLADDDHTQYHNNTRGDARYSQLGHGHAIADTTGLQSALDGKQAAGSYAAASHSHAIADTTGLQSALDGKQAAGSYAAASHSHAISDTTGLQSALDGKAAASHSHAIADVTGLQSALDGKQAAGSYAAASHSHAIADTTGLQSALDGKAAASHSHAIADTTGLQTALDGKQATITTSESVLTSPVSMPSSSTWYSGPELTLGVGTWEICVQITINATNGGRGDVRIFNGTQAVASGSFSLQAGRASSVSIAKIVTVTSGTVTYTMQAYTNVTASTILHESGLIAQPGATFIYAKKIA